MCAPTCLTTCMSSVLQEDASEAEPSWGPPIFQEAPEAPVWTRDEPKQEVLRYFRASYFSEEGNNQQSEDQG